MIGINRIVRECCRRAGSAILFVTVRVMDSRNNRFYLFVELIIDLDSGCIFPGLLLGVLIRMCRVQNVKQI